MTYVNRHSEATNTWRLIVYDVAEEEGSCNEMVPGTFIFISSKSKME